MHVVVDEVGVTQVSGEAVGHLGAHTGEHVEVFINRHRATSSTSTLLQWTVARKAS
ncbi:hypothetical protein MLIT_39360 [Mycolicibacterium litorale]|uniref:Uncharacterized protein n=1 Tax=Mycolicibacterium litorale TaxID=758802 RepID=A0AAD1MTG8_9MYCO|nr:hypothetical protein MLIT_39360 [Mycolicibacterium litorale]